MITQEQIKLLFSKERMESYNWNLKSHFKNLNLIANCTTKIATLEIILRNTLDNVLKEKDKEWIVNSIDEKIINSREKILKESGEESLTHHQYLSRLSLGIIIHTIRKEKVQNKVMQLKGFKFRKCDKSNREYRIIKGKKTHFTNFEKVDIVLSLLRNLRNRSYHWENIQKVRIENGIIYPKLTTNIIKGTPTGIYPDKIQVFLKDLICIYDKELLKYC